MHIENRVSLIETTEGIRKEFPCPIKRHYLVISLSSNSFARYERQQVTDLHEEDGLLEGSLSIERSLTLSREAFAEAVFASLEHWRGEGTFRMVHGDSPMFNDLRDKTVVICDDTLEPITLPLSRSECHDYEIFCQHDAGSSTLTIPLVCFSRPAWRIIAEETLICIPAALEALQAKYQETFESWLRKIPKAYL